MKREFTMKQVKDFDKRNLEIALDFIAANRFDEDSIQMQWAMACIEYEKHQTAADSQRAVPRLL